MFKDKAQLQRILAALVGRLKPYDALIDLSIFFAIQLGEE